MEQAKNKVESAAAKALVCELFSTVEHELAPILSEYGHEENEGEIAAGESMGAEVVARLNRVTTSPNNERLLRIGRDGELFMLRKL